MARPREPVDLIKAKGKKHLTKAEYEERKEQELDVPFTDVEPPEYLSGEKQIEKFNKYAKMLLSIGIFTELDVDCLARYIMGEQLYLQYTRLLIRLVKSNNFEELSKIQGLQDKAFRQCQQCARDLGLTVSSRCKLVVPQVEDGDDYEL
jgi:P27 family predicted phage terminase small subunit